MSKTRCITLVLQFDKEGVDFDEMYEKLTNLLYDNTNVEVISTIPGVARTREETPVIELNQCDGCRAGIPLENGKYHRMGKPGGYVDLMVCEKDKYEGQHD